MEKMIHSQIKDSLFDERRWLDRLRHDFTKDVEDGLSIAVAVFDVPKLLRAIKPEAYAPHLFALGPYHVHRPELRDMERYKVAAAKRVERAFKNIKFDDLIKEFVKLETEIRAPYHRYLDMSEETLAWIMAIDTCFLLEFLQNYHNEEGTGIIPPSTNWISGIVKDMMMLENQIPIFLLRKTLELKYSSVEVADNILSTIFERFVKEVCPFQITVSICKVEKHVHLLELLYNVIVPNIEDQIDQTEILIPDELSEFEDADKVKEAFNKVSQLDVAPIRFIKDKLISKPIDILTNLLGRFVTKIPLLSLFTPVVENFLSQTNAKKNIENLTITDIMKSPLLEEIMIPSVSKLVEAGIKFVPTEDGINGIEFDVQTASFKLPVVILDANTDVILRNLVAYEASVVKGPLIFARYTELMNGIIDTVGDVKILRKSGIIVNHMKSDKEVADLWNGMCRSIRLTRVPKIDRVIDDVKSFNNRKLVVKTNKFLKKYVFRSWRILTLLATLILLLMTGLQTFCSVYTCSRWFGSITPGKSQT
ncbi:hypothetical protein LUZ62_026339 [Rhynchospora pubera]|uniref:Uncharacterized protein n=1 Tax=Rhynchospora pubera TaxID=906938 RepID=A0AAV8HET1_9POAL|nr:hypothetical protein LUZ62_026339 [Rhynchospora pubera]